MQLSTRQDGISASRISKPLSKPFREPAMYVCHCNNIPEREILSVISKLVERDAQRNIQPQDVLLALNRRANCHGCFPL
ncbi:MAG: hypothetical protein ACR2O4_17810, partial [Hyphomicrobiaceae bacterium]